MAIPTVEELEARLKELKERHAKASQARAEALRLSDNLQAEILFLAGQIEICGLFLKDDSTEGDTSFHGPPDKT